MIGLIIELYIMEREKLKMRSGFMTYKYVNGRIGTVVIQTWGRVLKGKIKCSVLDTLGLCLISLEKSRLEIKIKDWGEPSTCDDKRIK